MLAFPAEFCTYSTPQEASPIVPIDASVQAGELNAPMGLLSRETVPIGVIGEPTPEPSITVTMQDVEMPWTS
jgi:hypothetical protein